MELIILKPSNWSTDFLHSPETGGYCFRWTKYSLSCGQKNIWSLFSILGFPETSITVLQYFYQKGGKQIASIFQSISSFSMPICPFVRVTRVFNGFQLTPAYSREIQQTWSSAPNCPPQNHCFFRLRHRKAWPSMCAMLPPLESRRSPVGLKNHSVWTNHHWVHIISKGFNPCPCAETKHVAIHWLWRKQQWQHWRFRTLGSSFCKAIHFRRSNASCHRPRQKQQRNVNATFLNVYMD